MARTDADSAHLLTSDIDPRDRKFLTGERTSEGFFKIRGGPESAIARGLAYASYCDLLWCETSKPDLAEARRFAEAIHAKYPNKMLAYNCSPSFNWKKNLDDATIAKFQGELAKMGYKFQFITLAGFHALNLAMYELARNYKDAGMTAYCRLQEKEFASEKQFGYDAVKHQRFVGTGYFDTVQQVITSGAASTTALAGSTETAQFHEAKTTHRPRFESQGNAAGCFGGLAAHETTAKVSAARLRPGKRRAQSKGRVHGDRTGTNSSHASQARGAVTIFAVVMAWPTWRWVWSAMWTSRPADGGGQLFLPDGAGFVEASRANWAMRAAATARVASSSANKSRLVGIGCEFSLQCGKLLRVESFSFSVGQQAVHAARDVADMEGYGRNFRGPRIELCVA